MGGWSLDGVNRQRCSSWEAGARKGRTDKGVVHGEGGELGRGGPTKVLFMGEGGAWKGWIDKGATESPPEAGLVAAEPPP